MGLDMFVREIRTWEQRELSRFAQAILNTLPKTYNVNSPDPDVEEDFDLESFLLKNPTLSVPYQIGEELVYWRKHPDLHGWMKNLFFEKGGETESDFNHDTVWLNEKDLLQLKKDIENDNLPKTSGFFFGDSDGRLKETEIEKIDLMLNALSKGSLIYYTSSW